MNFISNYGDDEDEKLKVNITPNILIKDQNFIQNNEVIVHNQKIDELFAPTFGPENPYKKSSESAGKVDEYHMNKFLFKEEYEKSSNPTEKNQKKKDKKMKKRKKGSNDPTSKDYLGPWATYEEDEEDINKFNQEFYEEPQEKEEKVEPEKKKEKKEKSEREEKEEYIEPPNKTTYHLKDLFDYQGRSFIHPPSDLKPDQISQNFLPKKKIHTFSGHQKGVNCIELFPKYGHLLLSGSTDTKIKIWDVLNHRECIRDYMGHEKGIKCISFQSDGLIFASGGYDNLLRTWDTETGKIIKSFPQNKVPMCAKYHPTKNQQLLVGTQDRKILQYDLRSGKIAVTYEGHGGAVNTINFFDNDQKIVTSSDDKSLRIWGYGIPVVEKFISDPSMYSMPSVALHPSGDHFVCQSMDNQILVYETKEKYKQHKNKKFVGHLTSGYACQVNFSNDGRFLISGDQDGKLWIWDWSNGKKLKTIKAHDGVMIGCIWHPIESSKVITCGWDGNIHMFD